MSKPEIETLPPEMRHTISTLTAGHIVILAASVFNPNGHLMKYQASLCPACSCTGSTWEVVELMWLQKFACWTGKLKRINYLQRNSPGSHSICLNAHAGIMCTYRSSTTKGWRKTSKNDPKTTQKDIQPSELRHVCWHCFLCLLYWPYWPCSG